MEKTTIRSLYRQTPADGSVVTVYGWVRTVRDSKTFGFVELNDGTFFKNLQVVLVEGRLPNFKDGQAQRGLGRAGHGRAGADARQQAAL